MVDFTGNTFSGSQLASGVFTDVLEPEFTGAAPTLVGTVSIAGLLTAAGQTATGVYTSVFGVETPLTLDYKGYFMVDGLPAFVFVAQPDLGIVGGAFAVTTSGKGIELDLLQVLNPGVPASVCFLAGTLISTRNGERPVEQLRIGDLVTVVENGVCKSREIVWVGSQVVDVAAEVDQQAMRPIRVRAGAIAPSIPHTDLLVTPEHCLFVDGGLIPARMLVNGRSIVVETGLDRFTIHHVETERHAIVVANGALSESYLDTGNRRNFATSGTAIRPATPPQDWSRDAAAPLTVDRATVEPIWYRLDNRAEAMGLPTAARPTVVSDPDLRLVTETGREVRPLAVRDGIATFTLPGKTGNVRIASRSARPCDAIGPFVDDRRNLGVLIGSVTVIEAGGRRPQTRHLSEARLAGWGPIEDGSYRWTDGHAHLPLSTDGSSTHVVLEIEILAAGPYRVDDAIAIEPDTLRLSA